MKKKYIKCKLKRELDSGHEVYTDCFVLKEEAEIGRFIELEQFGKGIFWEIVKHG